MPTSRQNRTLDLSIRSPMCYHLSYQHGQSLLNLTLTNFQKRNASSTTSSDTRDFSNATGPPVRVPATTSRTSTASITSTDTTITTAPMTSTTSTSSGSPVSCSGTRWTSSGSSSVVLIPSKTCSIVSSF